MPCGLEAPNKLVCLSLPLWFCVTFWLCVSPYLRCLVWELHLGQRALGAADDHRARCGAQQLSSEDAPCARQPLRHASFTLTSFTLRVAQRASQRVSVAVTARLLRATENGDTEVFTHEAVCDASDRTRAGCRGLGGRRRSASLFWRLVSGHCSGVSGGPC